MLSAGIEPALPVPQTGVLSVERRELNQNLYIGTIHYQPKADPDKVGKLQGQQGHLTSTIYRKKIKLSIRQF